MSLTINGAIGQLVEFASEEMVDANVAARPVGREKRGLAECPVGGRR